MFLTLTADHDQISQISWLIELQLDSQNADSPLNIEPVQIDADALGARVYAEIESACGQNASNSICTMFQLIAEMCDWSYIGRRLVAWHKVRAPWYYE